MLEKISRPNPVGPHGVEQVDGADEVVAVVLRGVGDALGDRGRGGEVHHRLGPGVAERRLEAPRGRPGRRRSARPRGRPGGGRRRGCPGPGRRGRPGPAPPRHGCRCSRPRRRPGFSWAIVASRASGRRRPRSGRGDAPRTTADGYSSRTGAADRAPGGSRPVGRLDARCPSESSGTSIPRTHASAIGPRPDARRPDRASGITDDPTEDRRAGPAIIGAGRGGGSPAGDRLQGGRLGGAEGRGEIGLRPGVGRDGGRDEQAGDRPLKLGGRQGAIEDGHRGDRGRAEPAPVAVGREAEGRDLAGRRRRVRQRRDRVPRQ